MKCVICNSPNIEIREVEEEIQIENDIVLIPVKVHVCLQCGERYYDRKTMRKLEKIEKEIRTNVANLQPIGKVVRVPETV